MKNLFILLLLFNFSVGLTQVSKLNLNQGWSFRSMEKGMDFLLAKVPGNVHADLYANQIIPHPFEGDNEKDLQWISNERWQYILEFNLTNEQLKNKNIDLIFEGVDTYAAIYLNEERIDLTNNAFRTWKYDVKKLLKKKNRMVITFLPTRIYEEEAKSKIPYELPEGNRIFTRKAQFQYGWDWGPKYNTMGIWRPVYLEFWNDVKLNDLYLNQLYVNEHTARMNFEINLKSKRKQKVVIDCFVNDKKIQSMPFDLKNENYNITTPFNIDNPKLWWTHNLGQPYLYEFKVQIRDLKGNLMDEKIVKKGLRTIELVTEKDEFGESFYFKLNGEPVYMKGANYIPQSPFQNWVEKEDYEKLLNDVRDSNMNMLRIWGGGIYEDDYFYELCDEKGILVWQDFMFACAMYPGDEDFLENVRQEAIDNVKRLRNHSSIALWCGNNEISEGWHRWGWQDGRTEAEKAEIWGNYQKLFNGILPEIVHQYTDLPYWESSPKFGRGDERYISEGDAHDWWIWHDGKPFEDLENKPPRFMSEFGFQSFPSKEVIQFINEGKSTSISSEEFKNHQKHPRGFDIIKTYMERDFPVPENEEDYVYVSQLLQAYGIRKGIEAQRRNKPITMGSLYWQLNDVWPSVSWSSIDFKGNWKAMHYAAQQAFQEVMVSFERTSKQLKVYIVNDSLSLQQGKLKVNISNFDGIILEKIEKEIIVKGNSSHVVHEIDISQYLDRKDEIYVCAEFNGKDNIYYFVAPKELKLKERNIKSDVYETADGSGFIILLESPTLQRFVEVRLNAEGHFSNNYFDILPNKPYVLFFESKNPWPIGKKIEFKSLNNLKTGK